MLYVPGWVVPGCAAAASVSKPPTCDRFSLGDINVTVTWLDSGTAPLRLSLASRFNVPPGLSVAASATAAMAPGTVMVTATVALHGVLAGLWQMLYVAVCMEPAGALAASVSTPPL